MDICPLLLGRPRQYDHRVTHDRHINTYSFYFNNTKIVLLPSRNVSKSKSIGDNTNLLSLARFEDEMKGTWTLYVLIGNDYSEEVKIPEETVSLIKEFGDVFLNELPDGLPPLRDIQHQIELEPWAIYQIDLTIG